MKRLMIGLMVVLLSAGVTAAFVGPAAGTPRRCRDCSLEKTVARLFRGHERQRHVLALMQGGVVAVECARVGHSLYGCSIEANQCVVAAVVRLEDGRASYPWLKESEGCST